MKAGTGLVESDQDQFGITCWCALHTYPIQVFRRAGLGPAGGGAGGGRGVGRGEGLGMLHAESLRVVVILSSLTGHLLTVRAHDS